MGLFSRQLDVDLLGLYVLFLSAPEFRAALRARIYAIEEGTVSFLRLLGLPMEDYKLTASGAGLES